MAVVVVCSATGSPGVTTSAVGLALHWPKDVLLVDADRVPSQTIESGHLAGVPTQGRGLLALAQAHRERRSVQGALWELSVPLTEDAGPVRRFLAGFSHPGAAGLFEPMWGELASNLSDLEASGVDVVVDAGRIGAGLPRGLVQHADSVLVVTRSSLRALAALRLTLPTVVDQTETDAPRAELGLLVVGPGRPYSDGEIADHFAVPVLGAWPWEPEAAAVWSDGAAASKKMRQAALPKAATAMAHRLAGRLGRRARMLAEATA